MLCGVALTRENKTIQDLRRFAKTTTDAGQRYRLLAIAMVREGLRPGEGARLCSVQTQTLRNWVIAYNQKGPEVLSRHAHPMVLPVA